MRLKIVRIRSLRQHGYEGADKTVAATLPVSAVLVGTSDENVGATIGRPLLRLLSAVRHRDTALNNAAIVGGELPLRRAVRSNYGFVGIFDTVPPQKPYRYYLKAPSPLRRADLELARKGNIIYNTAYNY